MQRHYFIAATWLEVTLVLAVLLLAGGLLCGCASQEDASQATSDEAPPAVMEASALLERYDLPSAGDWTWNDGVLDTLDSESFPIYAQASKSIGLDLTGYASRQVRFLSVSLQGRSQAWDGRDRDAIVAASPSAAEGPLSEEPDWRNGGVRAWFIVEGDRVVGAYLVFDGYAPGIGSLADRSEFMPEGLTPAHLDFADVASVEVIGPWSGGDWRTRRNLTDSTDVQRVLTLLAASRRANGERFGVQGDEEYMIVLTYRGGEEVRARLVTKRKSGETFVTFDPGAFSSVHYAPPLQLKVLVKTMLGDV